jgi:hypothetical protein
VANVLARWVIKTNFKRYEEELETLKDDALKQEIKETWWPGAEYEVARNAWIEENRAAVDIPVEPHGRSCVLQ